MKKLFALFISILIIGIYSCRKDELVLPTEYDILPLDNPPNSNYKGMYLLNEGNMGSNKASIDYLNFKTGFYERNIYPEKNPNVIKELGDVGNDIQIYGNKLYAVVNCSHKVEVINVHTGIRIKKIDVPNCRYIRFHRGKAYVSSYVGPIAIDPNAQLGAVFKIDTASLEIEGRVTVGYQPDELEIIGQYIYVANSGGYRIPYYDNTISIIEIEGFKQIKKIPVGINLHHIKADQYKKLWVSSRGDYKRIHSKLFVLEKEIGGGSTDYKVTDTLAYPCSNMIIKGDSLFLYSVAYSYETNENTVSYGIINVKTKELISKSFITDGTEKDIKIPYGINIHPETGDIYITDAKNYVSSGMLYCYNKYGQKKWGIRTGDIPAHMVFVPKSSKKTY